MSSCVWVCVCVCVCLCVFLCSLPVVYPLKSKGSFRKICMRQKAEGERLIA